MPCMHNAEDSAEGDEVFAGERNSNIFLEMINKNDLT